jgi:hypothetical protein
MRMLDVSIWPPSIPDPKFLHVCLLSFVLSASPVTPVRWVGPRGHKACKDFPYYHFMLSILEYEGNEKFYEYGDLYNFNFYFNIRFWKACVQKLLSEWGQGSVWNVNLLVELRFIFKFLEVHSLMWDCCWISHF